MTIGLDGERGKSELNRLYLWKPGDRPEKGTSVPAGKELMLSGIAVVLGTLVPVGLWGCAGQLGDYRTSGTLP